jgi:maltooligosyltrehalose trehalohydrolase
MKPGAKYLGAGKCKFTVWAPNAERVDVRITAPTERIISLDKRKHGYWLTSADGIGAGSRYVFRLDLSTERPDPASHFQPDGLHKPSEVVDHASFQWSDDAWHGVPLEQMILYELHVGTFTKEGTFEAIIPRLSELAELGINVVELMPVAQFPGERNWGYDGVYPFAVQNSYGGPENLKKLVDACHRHDIAVVLDVVYNHLGPEGNYLHDFGPYFTDKYRTPWGKAVNFDGAHSDEVRNYFISNALYWFTDYHIDALRLDALHAIYDMSAKPFLRELAEQVEEFSRQAGRRFYLIAESDLNDTKLIKSPKAGGYGLDAQWCDDFHHSLHALLTDESFGYYRDFGDVRRLAKSLREGFVYSWQYSEHRQRHHGNSSKTIQAHRFVVFAQNHDQIGNRMLGRRMSALVSYEALKLAAGAVLLSPYIPLLFMGEEYGEESPFLYFVSHCDADLVSAVREGRKSEFDSFQWQGEPPDPQDTNTFLQSKLNWETRDRNEHKSLLSLYRDLIRLRRNIPALAHLSKKNLQVDVVTGKKLLVLRRWQDGSYILCLENFERQDCTFRVNVPDGRWVKILDSAEEKWAGPGSSLPEVIEQGRALTARKLSFAVFELQNESRGDRG